MEQDPTAVASAAGAEDVPEPRVMDTYALFYAFTLVLLVPGLI